MGSDCAFDKRPRDITETYDHPTEKTYIVQDYMRLEKKLDEYAAEIKRLGDALTRIADDNIDCNLCIALPGTRNCGGGDTYYADCFEIYAARAMGLDNKRTRDGGRGAPEKIAEGGLFPCANRNY